MVKNLKFSHKIILMPALAAFAFVVILIVTLSFHVENRKVLQNIEAGYFPALEMSHDLVTSLEETQRKLSDAVSAADREQLSDADKIKDSFLRRLQTGKGIKMIDGGLIDSLATKYTDYFRLAKETSQRMINQEVGESVQGSLQRMSEDYRKLKETLESFAENSKKEMEQASSSAQKNLIRSTSIISLVILLSLLIMIGISWLTIRSTSSLLNRSLEIAKDLAQGNLTGKIAASDSNDEIGRLQNAFISMVANLRGMISRVQETSLSLASAADEISATTEQITKGAQNQVRASNETSSSMEEMSVSIQGVSKNAESLAGMVNETVVSMQEMGATARNVATSADEMARNVDETSATIEQMVVTLEKTLHNILAADKLSRQATTEASIGGDAVIKMIDGMRHFSEMMKNIADIILNLGRQSESIGNIIEVIEDIADQTNLLALNAAIEAARAGDAGRGFAVVANEIRKLAERSIKSTKDIGQVIKQVQKETANAVKATEDGARGAQDGILLADQAGSAIKKIIDAVKSSSGIMGEIARSTEEQSMAARNAITSVEDMNRLTQAVTQAIREQTSGIQMTTESAEGMNQMTEHVSQATKEQKIGGENVVKAVENINDIANANLSAVVQLQTSARDMAQQSLKLQELISQFRIVDEQQP
jgi:methyl-accepting chemotaxis protein